MRYNNNPLRTLARSKKWQTLYRQSKDIASLQLFANLTDLFDLQINFLQWLHLYNYLDEQRANGDKLITKELLEDDMRVDAYLVYTERQRKREEKPNKTKKVRDRNSTIPSVVFRKRKR